MANTASGRRFLALFRAGKNSLHPQLTKRLEKQNFDYALSWYADEDAASLGMAEGAAFVHRVKGQKWPGLYATLTEYRDVIDGYDYVWFPDDDLLATPETVSEFFSTVSDLRLDLGQPALTLDSSHAHPIVVQHATFQVRFTNFVELMAPLMSRDMLRRTLPTMDGTLSGWGIDAVWPRFTRIGRIAIIDSTPVKHTREILVGGNGYRDNASQGIPPLLEEKMAFVRYGVTGRKHQHLNLGALLDTGDLVHLHPPKQDGTAPLMARLLHATKQFSSDPIGMSRYINAHAEYIEENDGSLLPLVLDEALGHLGLRTRA